MKSSNQGTRHRRENSASGQSTGKKLLRSLLFGVAALVASAVLLLWAGAMIAYGNEDPARLELPLALSALYISLFIGGVVTARLSPFGALLGGLCFSAIFSSVICLLGMIMAEGSGISSSGLYLAIAAVVPIAGAMASAFLESRRQGSAKKRSGRHKKRNN